jgi:hypothetical protein
MIDVEQVLRAVPDFECFCSVNKLQMLVKTLRGRGFRVEEAGTSQNGVPIHRIQFGAGSVKALIVAFPHCSEPIGGLTAYTLLMLLAQGNSELLEADVEWNIVPCIDPDGAILNEGWTQTEFTLENHMRNFFKQEPRDQVECSFPIHYKRLVFDRPTKEARILQGLLEKIRPDFYYSLHSSLAGGAYHLLSRDIDHKYHQQIYTLLAQHHIPLQVSPPGSEWYTKYGEAIFEPFTFRKYYDFLEKTTAFPERLVNCGACSWEFLAEIKPDALTCVSELPFGKHPSDGSLKETAQNMRQLKLRMDADSKFVVTVILEEWEKVKGDINSESPLHRKILNGMVTLKDKLIEGLPWWPDKTQDILFNPAYSRTMTEGERFREYFWRYYLLCNGNEFVRLLKASTQTRAVAEAVKRLESVFNEALQDIANNIAFADFEVIDCRTLAQAQLGSGLIVLNSLLEERIAL